MSRGPRGKGKRSSIMSDVIDRDGFRANVGIVLMQDGGQAVHRPAHGRPRLAVSAGRHAARGEARGGAVPRTQRGDRPAPQRRRDHRPDPALAALPPAGALPAARTSSRCASGRSSAGSCCACSGRTPQFDFDPHRRAGIRPVALGRLLGAGARGHLFQARGVHPRAARARRAGLSARQAAAVPGLVARSTSRRRSADAASRADRPSWAARRHPRQARGPQLRAGAAAAMHAGLARCCSALSRCTWPSSSAATTPATTAPGAAQQRTELRGRRSSTCRKANREMRMQLAAADTFRVAAGARAQRSRAHHRRAAGAGRARAAGARVLPRHRQSAGARPASAVRDRAAPRLTADARRARATRCAVALEPADAAGGIHRRHARLTLDGERAGAAASARPGALTGGRVRELRYSFRYFHGHGPGSDAAGRTSSPSASPSRCARPRRTSAPVSPDLRVESRRRDPEEHRAAMFNEPRQDQPPRIDTLIGKTAQRAGGRRIRRRPAPGRARHRQRAARSRRGRACR